MWNPVPTSTEDFRDLFFDTASRDLLRRSKLLLSVRSFLRPPSATIKVHCRLLLQDTTGEIVSCDTSRVGLERTIDFIQRQVGNDLGPIGCPILPPSHRQYAQPVPSGCNIALEPASSFFDELSTYKARHPLLLELRRANVPPSGPCRRGSLL